MSGLRKNNRPNDLEYRVKLKGERLGGDWTWGDDSGGTLVTETSGNKKSCSFE